MSIITRSIARAARLIRKAAGAQRKRLAAKSDKVNAAYAGRREAAYALETAKKRQALKDYDFAKKVANEDRKAAVAKLDEQCCALDNDLALLGEIE